MMSSSPSPTCLLLASCIWISNVGVGVGAQLLPGLTYSLNTQELSGKLAFLVQNDYTVETNSETAASIYTFDLSRNELKKVTDSPNGSFVAAGEGGLFCVNYWVGNWGIGKNTNIFVSWNSLGSNRTINVESSPVSIFAAEKHVFMKLQGYSFPNPSYYLTKGNQSETKLLDYDVTDDKMKTGSVSDPVWQSHETARLTHRAFDGKYVFFEGSGAPIEGSTLITSPRSYMEVEDLKQAGIRVLHKFPMRVFFSGRTYRLLQMSPDHHYALVMLIRPLASRKASPTPGSGKTYYIVDVSTGKTRVLLEDNSQAMTSTSVSEIRWVR